MLAGQASDAERASASPHWGAGDRPTLDQALRTIGQQKVAIEKLESIVSLSRIQLARLCAGGEFAEEVGALLKGRDTSSGAAKTYAEAKEFLGELLELEGMLKPREATMAERLMRGENLRSLTPEAKDREREPAR
jgi:hypothetical protein